jgi:hypothetical protein
MKAVLRIGRVVLPKRSDIRSMVGVDASNVVHHKVRWDYRSLIARVWEAFRGQYSFRE